MSSIQRHISPGSDGSASIDERKRKRMESNRESARRSRMKKQKLLEDLTYEISSLQISNNQFLQSINAKEEAFMQIDSSNNVLRAQAMELTDRLRSLNSVLQIVEQVSGLAVEIPEIPDPLLKPWQVPYTTQPITASSEMYLS